MDVATQIARAKDKPIIFSGPMIRAILEGRKTQTRRVIQDSHAEGIEVDGEARFMFMHGPHCGGGCDYACASSGEIYNDHIGWTPWGTNQQRLSRLWVRETWRPYLDDELFDCIRYDADGLIQKPTIDDVNTGHAFSEDCERWGKHGANRSPIHMPRWASRIMLALTRVGVERVQDISDADCIAEGATSKDAGWLSGEPAWRMDWSKLGQLSRYAGGIHPRGQEQPLTASDIGHRSPKMAFAETWNGLNMKRGHGWDVNPWVWVLEFERTED